MHKKTNKPSQGHQSKTKSKYSQNKHSSAEPQKNRYNLLLANTSSNCSMNCRSNSIGYLLNQLNVALFFKKKIYKSRNNEKLLRDDCV